MARSSLLTPLMVLRGPEPRPAPTAWAATSVCWEGTARGRVGRSGAEGRALSFCGPATTPGRNLSPALVLLSPVQPTSLSAGTGVEK